MRNSRENEAKTGAKGKEELPKSEWIAFLFLSRLNNPKEERRALTTIESSCWGKNHGLNFWYGFNY